MSTGLDPARAVLRFGPFELDRRSGELRKHGVKLKLQGKPLQVLEALLERPGEIVSREALQSRLWPSDVFVDFEAGLNTAANRLRIVLGDSAENPRYIETLPRTGYRFVAPVEEIATEPPVRREPSTFTPFARGVAGAMALVALLVASWLALRRPPPVAFEFRQVTFRHGQIWGARFAPDGKSILYTASWDNGPRRMFLTYPSSPESRPLGFDDLRLVAVSKSGELALLSFDGTLPVAGGTLSRVPMNGGAPSPVEQVRNDNRGSVKITTLAGAATTLSGEWTNVGGIAWHPSGEIWFSAARDGAPKSLWAVTAPGSVRPVAQIAGSMTLRDISADGSVLLSRDTTQLELAAVTNGAGQRNLTWLDWSRVADISGDGSVVLFDEEGVAAGAEYVIYIHKLADGSTMQIGEGTAMALAPAGNAVLAGGTRDRRRLRLLPLGHGAIRELPETGLEYQWVRFFPDGRRMLSLASEPGQPLRLYVLDLDGGKPIPVTPPTVTRTAVVSPDGAQIALLTSNGKLMVYPSNGGSGRVVPTASPLGPLIWSDDDWLYVQHLGAYTQIPTRVSRFHFPTGRLEPWSELRPADTLGVNAITKVMVSQDARTVVFNYRRALSELFVATPAAR